MENNSTVLTDRDFLVLKSKIFKDTTLDCHQYKDNYLKRRIGVRMRSVGVETYRNYFSILERNKEEYKKLLNDITINVTHFFRDPEAFRVLEDEVFPIMIYNKVKKGRRVIRLWSAGCSSGEEPYTLAIIIRELIEDQLDNFILSIQGTDVDKNILNAARRGTYLPRQMEFMPPLFLRKYFTFDGELYHIGNDIKDMVRFKSHDLFKDRKGANFDVILCRNVVIYFTKEMQEILYMGFYDALNDDGYLVLGKTETLVGPARDLFEIVNTRERIYQKVKK